jgi:hypothetical protein
MKAEQFQKQIRAMNSSGLPLAPTRSLTKLSGSNCSASCLFGFVLFGVAASMSLKSWPCLKLPVGWQGHNPEGEAPGRHWTASGVGLTSPSAFVQMSSLWSRAARCSNSSQRAPLHLSNRGAVRSRGPTPIKKQKSKGVSQEFLVPRRFPLKCNPAVHISAERWEDYSRTYIMVQLNPQIPASAPFLRPERLHFTILIVRYQLPAPLVDALRASLGGVLAGYCAMARDGGGHISVALGRLADAKCSWNFAPDEATRRLANMLLSVAKFHLAEAGYHDHHFLERSLHVSWL